MEKIFIIGISHLSQKIALQLRKENRNFVLLPGEALKEEMLVKFEGIEIFQGDNITDKYLSDAKIDSATCVIITARSDEINIYTTLLVRELNPTVKIIVELMNYKLCQKIEKEINNCYALSASSLSAPSFATASVFKYSFFSLEFEDELYSFSIIPLDIYKLLINMPRKQVEEEYKLQILYYEDKNSQITKADKMDIIPESGNLIVFAASENLEQLSKFIYPVKIPAYIKPVRKIIKFDRFLITTLAIIIIIIGLSTLYFHYHENLPLLSSLYFVITTISTVGYGDISLKDSYWLSKVIGILLMLAGVTSTALIFALITNSFIKKRTDYIEGRHKYNLKGHAILCGLGAVGHKIIDSLMLLNQEFIVIERNREDLLLLDLERRNIPYMIADASLEQTLIDANIQHADSIICAMNGDLICLEIGLNALSLNSNIRVVLRIFDEELAKKIQQHFRIHTALSISSLSVLSFVSLTLEEKNLISVVPYKSEAFALAKFKRDETFPESAIVLVKGKESLVCYPLSPVNK